MDLPENKLADLIKDHEKAMWRPVNNHNITRFTQDDIQRNTKNYATHIGKGAFGEVYHGILDDGSQVAVKKYIQKNYNEGFAKELIVHSQINHKSVVRLLGYCAEENALMMVTEFVSKGNLSKLLHESHDPISLATRLSIAMECAEALNYMHSMYQPIIHGDIKPENILLDDELGAKLSGFGISRLLSMDRTQYTNNVIGSIGYVDPEFVLKGRINPKNDVYSFGVVLLEVITRKKICENGICTDLTENFMKAFEKGKKVREMLDSEIVNVDSKILNKVGKLVTDCLKRNFSERPDMKDVVQRLHMHTKSYHEQGKAKTTQWSLWGDQKINQDNITTSSSNSTLLYKVGSMDIFSRTSRSKVIRNVSPTLVLFKMKELRPIFESGLCIERNKFFEIYKGYLGDDKWPVAVKRSIKDSVEQKDEFTNEIVIQSQVNHKNILKLIGCCLENDIPILIFEFASKGSLDGILHGSSRMPLNLDVRLQIAAQTARGLAYMHSEITTTILHCSVRPADILLNDDFVPKISSFGFSTLIARDGEYTDYVIDDIGYMDPVYLRSGLLTSKSDVYSFGIVLLELITRKKQSVDSTWLVKEFFYAYTNKKVIQVVDPEIAITENIKLLYSITEIIAQCLNLDVDQRPEMTDVATHLYMLIRANHQSDQLLETQSINHDGSTIYTSSFTQVYNVGNFDNFDLTAHRKFIKNNSPILGKVNSVWVFKKVELKPILENRNLIGKGEFADNYVGFIGGNYKPVAVKKPMDLLWIKEKTIDEINIQSRVIHKNILKLIGVCLEDDIPIMVFEFASQGSLADLLHGSNRMPLNLDVRLQIATQTARGLAYMHSETTMEIRHGNVKPDKILLTDDFVPKISGFSLSTLITLDRRYTNHVTADITYMDPVYRQSGLLTIKSDVFSFGIVLLKLITRKRQSVDRLPSDFLNGYTNDKVIPLVDPEIATTENMELLYSITEIIAQCLNLDVNRRPEMTYVAVCLKKILKRSQGKQVGLEVHR